MADNVCHGLHSEQVAEKDSIIAAQAFEIVRLNEALRKARTAQPQSYSPAMSPVCA